ncbi:site-specific DNA-methyltransferase [Aliarcobacter cryaerophilus]|uniref:site-specific DNA-methyltransferase n=1 Tax=Aliarcobacter cryaerophilus TaxID=28198 RepID=UPI0021B69A5A|nr:site-specific DNA-methyltransferase [Aliarcobacter cryaerophilus]MCT7488747.1 site-specific DNA-methyltransferase [Aliarcobacter cryaerophilus]
MSEIEKLKKEVEKLKKENLDLKKKKKFGLVWEEREKEKNIDDGEYYPYLVKKGNAFGFDNNETNKNILIEGDNYHALKILQYTHKEKIDVIYIDPPYNTGKKKEFKYGDSWIDKNSGYKHSYWLSFINKRLEIAKNLLSKDGLIFISIDENEYARLKLLCDDIFTSSNFIGSFVKKISGGKNDSKTIKVNHEYLLCYKRTEKATIHLNIEYTKKDETRSLQKDGDNEERFNRENLWYPIYANIKTKEISLEFKKDMIEIFPIKNDGLERYWRWEYDTAVKRINELRLTKTKFDDGKIKYDIGVFTPKGTRKELPWNSFISDFSAGGGTQLKEVLGKKIAGMYPKNLDYIKWICNLSVKKNPIILDFFAGSGTTGQALEELKKDISSHIENPKYILITNNENNICEEVCYQRIKKANEKYNYNSNLEYLKTELLKYDSQKHSDLDIKEFMVDKLIEIIKVREACFKLDEINKFLLKFAHINKSVYVLQDIYKMKKNDYDEVVSILKDDEKDKINIYILSMSNHEHYINKISKAHKNITFEPLPESFLKILRKIERKRR